MFRTGDRILSVTISFENMVYEDALTILSYASPYPVKVTLQKQHGRNRRPSSTPSILSHPLYRSQSMDTLVKIAKEPIFQPKRSLSEVRTAEKAQLTIPKKISVLKTNQENEEPVSLTKIPEVKIVQENKDINKPVPASEIIVHTTNVFTVENESGQKVISPAPMVESPKQQSIELESQNVTVTSDEQISEIEPDSPPPPVPSMPAPVLRVKDTADSANEFVDAYDKLADEDKLDMLRLSYEDPDSSKNNSVVIVPADASLVSSTPPVVDSSMPSMSYDTTDSTDPSAPNKPERRKKKSFSSEEGASEASSSRHSQEIENIIVDIITLSREQSPKDNVGIYEDMIVAERKDRDSSIMSEQIEFAEVEQSIGRPISPDEPIAGNRTLVDYSLSEAENSMHRPHSPDTQPPIEEEDISPNHKRRDPLEVAMSHIFNRSKQSKKNKIQGSTSSSSLSSSDEEKSRSENESQDTVIEVNNDDSVLDLSLNSNPQLFSTPYRKSTQKEGSSGMSYDISMDELNSIESELKESKSSDSKIPKGGIAFEVRDDLVSGGTVTIDRQLSDRSDSSITKYRTGSLKENGQQSHSSEGSLLEWSGQRLVRAGSFSDIPQNDSVSDWTEQINKNDDDSTLIYANSHENSTNSSEENINQSDKAGLSRAKFFGACENLANLSDNSDSVVMNSASSSRSSTPPPPYNGESEEINISQNTTPTKTPLNALSDLDINHHHNISTDQENNQVITNVSPKIEGNNTSFSVTVTTSSQNYEDDDTEC